MFWTRTRDWVHHLSSAPVPHADEVVGGVGFLAVGAGLEVADEAEQVKEETWRKIFNARLETQSMK